MMINLIFGFDREYSELNLIDLSNDPFNEETNTTIDVILI